MIKGKKILVVILFCLLFFSGCEEKDTSQDSIIIEEDVAVNEDIISSDLLIQSSEEHDSENLQTENDEETSFDENNEIIAPTEEEVLAKQEQAFEGMSDKEINRLKENVKMFNFIWEERYLYHNIFWLLEDQDSLRWKYFHERGDIQVGTLPDGSPIMEYNRHDVETFTELFQELKESVNNELLKEDIQTLIDEANLAAETHDAEHAINMYKILHDMDYYVMRYGVGDSRWYVRDLSTVKKYYGVLKIYHEKT